MVTTLSPNAVGRRGRGRGGEWCADKFADKSPSAGPLQLVFHSAADPTRHRAIISLSKATYRKSLQNLLWAAGYNLAAIPLAAGALAWAGVSMPPAVAAVLMSVSTIVVALNAQLLRRLDLRPTAIATNA